MNNTDKRPTGQVHRLGTVCVVISSLALAACGGGGGSGGSVGSTPAPPPAPSPTPTPTPPPPPPAPTTANADLLNLTQSENFTNDAATGSGTYDNGGGGTAASAGPATLTVAYDAGSRTYTITNGGRSLAFAPSHIDAPSSNSAITVYKRTSGTTTDTLTLTKPGTSGKLTYRYVGSGFWQRTTQGATSYTALFDAFTYGAETADAAMVRTGGANYAVDLLGVAAYPETFYALSGSGTLTANFLNGTLTGRNFNGLQYTRADTGALGLTTNWEFNGTIASDRNAINGTIILNSSSSQPVTGPGVGRFFGPGMDELGIAFNATTTSPIGNIAAVGTIMGRKSSGTISGQNASLADLQFDQIFPRLFGSVVSWNANSSAGAPTVFSIDYRSQDFGFDARYSVADRAFSLVDPVNSNAQVITTVGTADAGLTDSRFLGYSTSAPDKIQRLRMYRIGSGNSELALTYSSFYNLEQVTQLPGSTTSWTFQSIWSPFGVTTTNAAMPTTGSASYSGFLHGTAIDGGIGDQTASVSGTIAIGVNFGTAVVDGTINPIITYRNGTTYNLGVLNLFNGTYSNPGVNLGGVSGAPYVNAVFGYQRSFGTGPNGPVINGFVNGTFFGPNYQELTGRWGAEYIPAGTASSLGRMWGAFGTKKN